MSVYSSGAEALRDTTKWLTALVPIAAVLGAGGVLGPVVIDAGRSADLQLTGPIIGGAILSLLGVLAILISGGLVLAAQPRDLASTVTRPDSMSDAFASGVTAPYFLDERTYMGALNDLQVEWDKGASVPDTRLTRAVAATDLLREWSLHQAVVQAYAVFRWILAGAIIAIGVGFTLCVVSLPPQTGNISNPVKVDIRMSSAGAAELVSTTGCSAPDQTKFIAVGGTWRHPVLVMEGPGCRFGTDWLPSEANAQILGLAP